MRTFSILFAVLTVYCGSLLVAAWSFTAFKLEPAGFSTPALATATPTTTKRVTPATRWRPAIREQGHAQAYYDTLDVGDEYEAEPTTTTVERPTPRRVVDYDAARGTRL